LHAVYLVKDQPPGIALAGMTGAGAYCAHFGVVESMQALAGHGYQLIALKNTVVMAKIDGSGSKGAGVGELGKFQHLRHVPVAQRDQINCCFLPYLCRFANHLHAVDHAQYLPHLRNLDFVRGNK